MNKFSKLLLLIPIIIIGCKNTNHINSNFNQVIDKFDMNIYSTEGEKVLSIKSPSSRYENSSNIINLDETKIYLFKNNETEYIINSNKSKLSGNRILELTEMFWSKKLIKMAIIYMQIALNGIFVILSIC